MLRHQARKQTRLWRLVVRAAGAPLREQGPQEDLRRVRYASLCRAVARQVVIVVGKCVATTLLRIVICGIGAAVLAALGPHVAVGVARIQGPAGPLADVSEESAQLHGHTRLAVAARDQDPRLRAPGSPLSRLLRRGRGWRPGRQQRLLDKRVHVCPQV